MIARVSILSGTAVLVTDLEWIVPFTASFITNIELIWDKMVAIFQGSDAWKYLKPANKNCYGRLGLGLSYNHYLVPSNIYHMIPGAKKKIPQFSYTGEKRNFTLDKNATLHKEQHKILEILKEHGYTGTD